MRVARRNKKHAVHENHERWLITYSDLITLLLIFFVIMYAMSKVDTEKYAVLAQTLNMQFQKAESIVPNGEGLIGNANPSHGKDGDTKKDNPAALMKSEEELKREQREQSLQDLMQKVNQYISENNLQAQVSVADTQRGIAVTLNDLFLFDLGKADLKAPAYPILEKLASLIPTLNTKVSIDGHTDNLPLATGSLYKDNWGLSQARSLSVLRYFTTAAGLQDKTFVSSAYADTMPVAPNTSEENRAKNRRVEIVVLREP